MPTAYVLVRLRPEYRSEAFAAGLQKHGYTVVFGDPPSAIKADDLVVTWNLSPRMESAAKDARKVGATVLVAENGYCGKDRNGIQYYALSRDGHNGSGRWYAGGGDRWRNMRIDLQPWRTDGDYVLVADQRGIGSETMRSPLDFGDVVIRTIRAQTARPILYRPHPGREKPKVSLAEQLKRAFCLVTWSSQSATEALIAGVPSFYCAPHFICAGAATRLPDQGPGVLNNPPKPDTRLAVFERLAWAQWAVSELENGEAFRCLLRGHEFGMKLVGPT